MSESFVGEIRMFAGTFAPRGWAFCDGQLLAISQNDALFSLYGTIYGGDGRTTFGLPDLRGRIPLHQGHGPGLSQRKIGSKSGTEKVTLTTNQLPSHTHNFEAANIDADQVNPTGNDPAIPAFPLYESIAGNSTMNSQSIASSGGNSFHSNLMPTLCINYILSLFGTYPSRA